MNIMKSIFGSAVTFFALSAASGNIHAAQGDFSRALLISVDGMRAIDMALYTKNNPNSALAALARRGVNYTNARQPLMADSTPGLLSFATGGTPAVSGLFYSPFYDRALSPPGSDCSTQGTVYWIDEKWVLDYHREDSGGGIDPEKLARDPANGCAPVYPRELVKVNTMFEVVKKSGGRTAWIDQHAMYNDMLLGPAGNAIDDNRTLERKGTSQDLQGSTAQDGRRVELLLNQIRGYDSSGENKVGTPKLFGMGFISFGMVQKSHGYADAYGNPSVTVKKSLDFIDQQMARIVAELKRQKLYDSTLIIVSSKHGQNPIDVEKKKIIDRNVIRNAVNSVQKNLLAWASLDAIGMIWLNDAARTDEVVQALRGVSDEARIQKIYAGDQLNLLLPAGESRVPDIILQPELGSFYADDLDSEKAKALIAEHGGMLDEDTNVALLVSHKGLQKRVIRAPVSTAQIAPTILSSLGIDTFKLDAVQLEFTQPLPGWK